MSTQHATQLQQRHTHKHASIVYGVIAQLLAMAITYGIAHSGAQRPSASPAEQSAVSAESRKAFEAAYAQHKISGSIFSELVTY